MKKMKIPLSTFIFLSILMTSLEGFAQSKKEQIDALNFSIDSLVVENSNLKIKLLDKDKLISENEKVIPLERGACRRGGYDRAHGCGRRLCGRINRLAHGRLPPISFAGFSIVAAG